VKLNLQKRPKILLLFAKTQLFQSAKQVLQDLDFDILETYGDQKADAVLMDSFFTSSGAADFFLESEPETPVLHMAFADEKEALEQLQQAGADEMLWLPENIHSADLESELSLILKRSEYLKWMRPAPAGQEFGSGLWAFHMLRDWLGFPQKYAKIFSQN
jgi:hypothetical protein